MTDNTVITSHDIQLRFVSHSSNKIIINTNANFQKGDDEYSENVQIRNAESLKQQLISDHEKAVKFDGLTNAQKYNKCNPEKDGYCMFEKQVDDLQKENQQVQEKFSNVQKYLGESQKQVIELGHELQFTTTELGILKLKSKLDVEKLEQIKRLHLHAGCMGNPECHNCKVLKILKGIECEHDWNKESGLGGNTLFTCMKCGKQEMDD